MNQKGFSLVEVMVALGLVSGISYVVMTTMQMGRKGQVQIERRQELSQLRDQLYVVLSRNCGLGEDEVAFDPSDASGNTVDRLSSSNGLKSYEVGSTIFNKLTISSIRFTPVPNNSEIINALEDAEKEGDYHKLDTEYLTQLKLVIKMKEMGKEVQRSLPYYAFVTVDGAGNISSCRSMLDVQKSKDSCESLVGDVNGTWDETSLTCVAQVNVSETSDGSLDQYEKGQVNPKKYVLSEIE